MAYSESPLDIGGTKIDDCTRFEMSFNISGAVSVIFGSDGSNNLTVLKTGADPFQIKVTAE